MFNLYYLKITGSFRHRSSAKWLFATSHPPQSEVDEIFNIYLAALDLPENALKIAHKDHCEAGKSEVSISFDTRIGRIIDAVMSSDIDDAAKVKVYNIIKNIRGK